MARRIRRGDLVTVTSGNDRGKRGRVLRVLPDRRRVIVEGVNLLYKHLRRSQKNPRGGRIRREAPVHVSNVMIVDPETNRATRIRIEETGGRRTRVAAGSGASLDATPSARKAAKAAPDAEGGAEE